MSQKGKDSIKKTLPSRPSYQDDLTESRIITKNLVYVIGLSSSIANKDTLLKQEYFGQYGTIIKIVVNKNKAYNTNSPYGPSYSAYVTFSKPSEASIAILSLDETMVDRHLIRASFGTTKYCSFFLKGVECTNKDCLFLHYLADENDIIKRGDLNSNKTIFAQQQSYAIAIADVYNPEVKKQILSCKKAKSVFPSPDLIYKSIFVIENDPAYHKSHSMNNKTQKQKGILEEITKSAKSKNNNLSINKEKKEDAKKICNEHKLYLSRETSRFDFGNKKTSETNQQIEVPLHIQSLINKKINLHKLTKYMHQQIIDEVLQKESLNTTQSNDAKDEWTEFINENTQKNSNENTVKNDEYINDFDKINSFIINKCVFKN